MTVALLVAGAGAGERTATQVEVSAQGLTAPALLSSPKVVSVSSLPQNSEGAATKDRRRALPFLSPLGAKGLAQAKANAAANAPTASRILTAPEVRSQAGPRTPGLALQGFDGMKDSSTVCPPFGCEPPDHGIAADESYVVQVVNTSIAFYKVGSNKKPKQFDLIKFFKIPPPSPSGCDTLPFVADPRIFHDPATGRWVVAALQIEGALGIPCDFLSAYWVAVSKTSTPTGKWNIYSFDTGSIFQANDIADFTQLGFNTEGIFIGANQFDQDGNNFLGAWTLAIPKAVAEAGGPIGSISGFSGYTANDGSTTRTLDTVQPVVSYGDGSGGPAGELLISSFNEDVTESKVVVLDFSNALGAQNVGTCDSSHQCLSMVTVDVDPYTQPPLADNYPGCTDCLDTIDTRISATPVNMHGMVYATHDTAVDNGTDVNANVQWFIIKPVLDQTAIGGCTVCSQITSDTSLVDQGYLTHPGATDTWFGVIQPDREANVFIGYEYGSSSFAPGGGAGGTSPSSAYISRRVTATDWPDTGQFLMVGTIDTFNDRWGDYEAAAFASWNTNDIWLATEYSDATSLGDWGTHIDQVNYTDLTQQ